jgi:hypothetical protein
MQRRLVSQCRAKQASAIEDGKLGVAREEVLPVLLGDARQPQEGVAQTLGTVVPRLLTSLKASGSAPMVDLASRHAQEASETLKVLQDGDEENDG